ncbi:putative cytochrome P450 [Aureobasidium melanogenum CBS 110374]|uniref:Putative cytochrome P450 n=1 Tax=Aureobasidium melanogenum (strain CBS 110374) TaxID=1043003 RepID=A0A074VQD8_AURM1|nr:putative cytochrome P450 [Aureobasidium melanogenum CBS 110374]KEQ59892.1 putative cytochrome P450 [Aureobasidium melanogenum CBS 110374]
MSVFDTTAAMPWPIIYILLDLPTGSVPEFQHWLKHKDTHGPISSVTVLGQTLILIHDAKIAHEILVERANIHSGRPKLKFGFDLVGWNRVMAGKQCNATFKLHRRLLHQQLGSKTSVERYNEVQETAVGRFLWRVRQDNGAALTQHLKTEAGELILKVVYDYTIEPFKKDPLVDLVDEAMEQFSQASVPGRWMVDIFPFLANLPSWVPGTGFQKTAAAWRQTLGDVANVPYDYAKQQGKNKQTSHADFVTKSIGQAQDGKTLDATDEQAIKWTAASIYLGGADTSVSTMNAFFLAMSMFPDVQRKAQEEIDRVIGNSRLPTHADRENLPYVNAIVEEAQRWHPIAPMGLPHVTDREDIINGYRIPKDSLLLPAIWWFTRDPAVYHDPEAFKPERFLPPYNEPPATAFTFGFGRRICPGRVLADASLFLVIAQSLAVFSINKTVDKEGKVVEPVHGFMSGTVSYPKAFEVGVVPRSQKHEELIDEVIERYPWQESDAKYIIKA